MRCGAQRCTAKVVDPLRRSRTSLHLPASPHCPVVDFAMWRTTVAYVRRAAHRHVCRRSQRGLWVRFEDGRVHRRSARADRLGDLRDGWISWFDDLSPVPPDWYEVQLRIARIGGHAKTVERGNADCCGLYDSQLEDGYVYWIARSSPASPTSSAPGFIPVAPAATTSPVASSTPMKAPVL
jgi:hypothetical protein